MRYRAGGFRPNLEIIMDSGHKSKRLFTAYTTDELYDMVKSPNLSNAQRDKIQLAIRQRDTGSSDYVPPFKTPQLV